MFKVDLEDLQAAAKPEILARAVEYWENGHVRALVVSVERLSGTVVGTMGDYRVGVFKQGGKLSGKCDCPYRMGFCKHAAALAWGWLNEPKRFLSTEQVAQRAVSMTPGVLAGALVRLAERDPLGVAEVLELDYDRFRNNALVLNRLSENLTRGDGKSLEGLKTWRHVLDLLQEEPYEPNKAAWDRLFRLGLEYLKCGDIDPEFWEFFARAFSEWGRQIGREEKELPDWWEILLQIYREGQADSRSRLNHIIVASLTDEWSPLFFRSLHYPSIPEDAGWSLGLLNGGLLMGKGDLWPVAEWALAAPERTLELMDALQDWEAWDWLRRIAREGLKRFSPENHLIFRERLALAHCRQGEFRQALAFLLGNFRERPSWAEYLRLDEVALAAREPDRVMTEVRRLLAQTGKWELLTRIAVHRNDPELLDETAVMLESSSPLLAEAAQKLAAVYPTKARTLWEKRIVFLLELGTRRAVREAMPLIADLKRLCREQGWFEDWERLKGSFVEMILDPVALRMTGSLLAEQGNQEENHRLEAFR